jgi:hypothetical protein
MKNYYKLLRRWRSTALALGLCAIGIPALASSHREAPLIARDPQADNTDVYAFRSPDDTNTVTIIANYLPFQLPEGGPNYYTFGTNVRYEIHIKNNAATTGDDITYRFTFSQTNQDPTTFFNIRLGQQNLHTTYTCQKFVAGVLVNTTNGTVPPPNIGPRSINGAVGLNLSFNYDSLMRASIATAASGEKIFAGPVDDPFFVDLGGPFDVGSFRPSGPTNTTNPTKDGLARYNVNSIAIKVPISALQKNGQPVSAATSILDPNYTIAVWASASRQQINTLNNTGGGGVPSGSFIQVSRLGMPLTNEVVIPIGSKDRWNSLTAYDAANSQFLPFFKNPELALYMDNRQFGTAVPSLNALRIQKKSRPDIIPGGFDFGNGKKGLWPLKGNTALLGTALDPALFGNLLLPDSMSPRAVDIMPIFLTGVPNLAPYQLATGKAGGNPLAAGKPFINNFLPAIGDMLRLNMAVPVTPRTSPDFSSLGIIWSAVLGLTDARFNGSAAMQNIPNMDGFPNGRRLEDDVTTIELQAVGGVALAAIGLWYDDYPGGNVSPVTPRLTRALAFNAGPTSNDTTFKTTFPYVQTPWRGFDYSIQARF